MKNSNMLMLIGIILIIGCVTSGNSYATTTPELVIQQYFIALKQGDTLAIKEMLTGKMLLEKEKLLEKNKGYSEILRNHYKGSSLEIKNSRVDNSVSEIDVKILYPNGEELSTTFVLKKTDRESWKIAGEIDAKNGF